MCLPFDISACFEETDTRTHARRPRRKQLSNGLGRRLQTATKEDASVSGLPSPPPTSPARRFCALYPRRAQVGGPLTPGWARRAESGRETHNRKRRMRMQALTISHEACPSPPRHRLAIPVRGCVGRTNCANPECAQRVPAPLPTPQKHRTPRAHPRRQLRMGTKPIITWRLATILPRIAGRARMLLRILQHGINPIDAQTSQPSGSTNRALIFVREAVGRCNAN